MTSLFNRLRDAIAPGTPASVCLCTMAINEPYRIRARRLCADAAPIPIVVLTDEPGDFEDLGVRTVAHTPRGPMAADYLQMDVEYGKGRGGVVYHDKRFALMAALEDFETAIFIDADMRLERRPTLKGFRPGAVALRPYPRESIADHLGLWGPQRAPLFEELALEWFGTTEAVSTADWCFEGCFAVTRDGRESEFFEAWERGADFFKSRGSHSGEGGIIGMAVAHVGWTFDYKPLADIYRVIDHEAGGPKVA